MNEVIIWVVFWVCLAAVSLTFIITITAYYKDENKAIVEAIKAGSPPLEVLCAFEDEYGHMPTCAILASKK